MLEGPIIIQQHSRTPLLQNSLIDRLAEFM